MSRWGVSKTESKAIMTGDKKAALISSTRGILINSPRPKVWQELIHLGADRKGFYSYSLIESLLGYTYKGEFDANAKMPIGRVIPSSLNPSDAIINYTWTVINVTPGHSFVLSKWGSFLLVEINKKQTKLIVRTYGQGDSYLAHIIDQLIFPFHFIMERRMLIGIKEEIEKGYR